MNPKTYLEESARTASSQWNDDSIRNVEKDIAECCKPLSRLIKEFDDLKKFLFYKRPSENYPFFLKDESPKIPPAAYQNMLHSLIGIITEAGELAILLKKMIDLDELPSPAKVMDEYGDILWYMALGLRTNDQSFEETMSKNIEKLRVRYPDKFTTENAIQRNLDKEEKVFTKDS